MTEKLYGVYSVISNKSVRMNERFYVCWYNKTKEVPGKKMVKTNRGWFIDGHNVDEKSADMWFEMTKNDKAWRPDKKKEA